MGASRGSSSGAIASGSKAPLIETLKYAARRERLNRTNREPHPTLSRTLTLPPSYRLAAAIEPRLASNRLLPPFLSSKILSPLVIYRDRWKNAEYFFLFLLFNLVLYLEINN